MDLYEAIAARRSVREFTEEAIPEETLRRIVEAAYKAPANDHFRDWHFIVVTEKRIMREALEGVPKDLTAKDADKMDWISDPVQRESYRAAVPKQYSMLAGAAALIVPLMKKKTDVLHPADLSHLNCFASVWCSVENLWLAAAAEGYGLNVRIPLGDEEAVARKALGFPETYMVPCFIGIGRPAAGAERAKQIEVRLDEQLHWQRFRAAEEEA